MNEINKCFQVFFYSGYYCFQKKKKYKQSVIDFLIFYKSSLNIIISKTFSFIASKKNLFYGLLTKQWPRFIGLLNLQTNETLWDKGNEQEINWGDACT